MSIYPSYLYHNHFISWPIYNYSSFSFLFLRVPHLILFKYTLYLYHDIFSKLLTIYTYQVSAKYLLISYIFSLWNSIIESSIDFKDFYKSSLRFYSILLSAKLSIYLNSEFLNLFCISYLLNYDFPYFSINLSFPNPILY